jgi:hypothetical protein
MQAIAMSESSPETKPKFRRVRKEDVTVESAPKRDGLAVCLECWRSYMNSEDKALTASRMKLEGGLDDSDTIPEGYESDPYGDQHKADLAIGEATNAMINDLKPAHTWAITKACGFSTVWRFPSVNYVTALAAAHAALEEKLRRHIATATLFD